MRGGGRTPSMKNGDVSRRVERKERGGERESGRKRGELMTPNPRRESTSPKTCVHIKGEGSERSRLSRMRKWTDSGEYKCLRRGGAVTFPGGEVERTILRFLTSSSPQPKLLNELAG